MAGKAAGKDDKGAQGAKSAKGGGPSFGQTAIAFVVGGLIAGGLGGYVGYANAPSPGAPSPGSPSSGAPAAGPSGKSAAAVAEKPAVKEGDVLEMGVLDLPPIVTNLAAPTDIWVRLEASILFQGKTLPHAEAMAGEISGDILAYMRTLTLPQIQGVAGLQHLRADLAERAATRSDGKVRGLIIKALVVQ